MATQVCFDTKTQAMQLFLIQKRTTVCVFCELRHFAVFSFNVCTEAVSVSLFGKLQLMATQVCFDTKTQAMQLFLTQKHTTVCVFCELRRFCNIFFQCLHRSSFRKPICQFAMNGNAIPFFALLETTVTGKNSTKMHTKKSFLTFAFCLPADDGNFTKFQRENYQLKKVSTFPSMSFVVAPWLSKTR